jgi:hypothetical protein
MGILRSILTWIASVILFLGMISFIILYSLNVSGVLAPKFAINAISSILTNSLTGNITVNNQTLTSKQVDQFINNYSSRINLSISACTAKYPDCTDIACLAQEFIHNQCALPNFGNLNSSSNSSLTNLSINKNLSSLNVPNLPVPFIPLAVSDMEGYQFSAELLAAVGAALIIFFNITDRRKMFKSLGKAAVSAALASFIILYLPLAYILPNYLKINAGHGIIISIPGNLFSPLTSVVLTLDIIFGVIGAVLLVFAYVLFEEKRPSKKK